MENKVWDDCKVREILGFYFPKSSQKSKGERKGDCTMCASLLDGCESLSYAKTNQLLHLLNFGPVHQGFFQYYFCDAPKHHVYDVKIIEKWEDDFTDILGKNKPLEIKTVKQLDWGLYRFYIDALLFFGNIESAFHQLRKYTYKELKVFFLEHGFCEEHEIQSRGDVFKFKTLDIDPKFFVSEIACDHIEGGGLKKELLSRYDENKNKNKKTEYINDLIKPDDLDDKTNNLIEAMRVNCKTGISCDEDIKKIVKEAEEKLKKAKKLAEDNFKLYLSITNELDVYVATSMRKYSDFEIVSNGVRDIFKDKYLKDHCIRYFDPTNSATDNHENKGLAECLMVNCAKLVIYFAGEKDSFGKDAEAAIALSQGKPVIILCQDKTEGADRLKIFKDIHPLSRLTSVYSGVACGVLVTKSKSDVTMLINRLISNTMEYRLENKSGVFRVIEKITGCTYRLQTDNELLEKTFWNNFVGSDLC